MFRACQLLSHLTVKHLQFAVKHAPRRAYTMASAPTLMTSRDLPPHQRPPLFKVPPIVNPPPPEMSPQSNGRLRNGSRLPSSSRTREGPRLSVKVRPLNERPIMRKGPIRKPYKKKKKKQVYSRPTLPMIQFGKNAGWLLRHGARHLGFPIRPDGFMRLQDALHFSTLNRHTEETFLEHAINDPPQRFEVKKERDYFSVSDVEVWWVRAKEGHDIPGVYVDRKRLFPDTTLTEVYFRTGFDQWEKIKKQGIPPAHAGLIRLSATSSVKSSRPQRWYNRVNAVPIRFVTIAVDIRQAFALGIEFYRTRRGYIISPGNDEGVIPPSVFSSAVETVVSRQVLKPYVK